MKTSSHRVDFFFEVMNKRNEILNEQFVNWSVYCYAIQLQTFKCSFFSFFKVSLQKKTSKSGFQEEWQEEIGKECIKKIFNFEPVHESSKFTCFCEAQK